MNADEFVKLWKAEKDSFLKTCIEANDETAVSAYIREMNLSEEQKISFNKVIDQLLTDTFYSLLLGLDGCASIGDVQKTYKIYDESGNLISDCGELEAEAYEQFQEI